MQKQMRITVLYCFLSFPFSFGSSKSFLCGAVLFSPLSPFYMSYMNPSFTQAIPLQLHRHSIQVNRKQSLLHFSSCLSLCSCRPCTPRNLHIVSFRVCSHYFILFKKHLYSSLNRHTLFMFSPVLSIVSRLFKGSSTNKTAWNSCLSSLSWQRRKKRNPFLYHFSSRERSF